ncbi:MAG: hypothetical protein QOF61_1164 [Acidobacteriota bacterium]|nr:hypothetical protein [Acidobacteriota bacterium]
MRRIITRARLFGGRAVRAGTLSLFAALIFCATAEAQSGRRVRAGEKPGATPAPAPVIELPKPEAMAARAAKRTLPNVALVVAGRVDKTSDRAETIFNKFVERLSQSLKTTSLGLVKHEVAEQRARAETENYVIWLELERDSYQQGRVIFNSLDYVVKYSILAPGTGQVKAKGKLYYQAMGGARTRQGEGDIVKITPEDAGETAADLVLDWLVVVAARRDTK